MQEVYFEFIGDWDFYDEDKDLGFVAFKVSIFKGQKVYRLQHKYEVF